MAHSNSDGEHERGQPQTDGGSGYANPKNRYSDKGRGVASTGDKSHYMNKLEELIRNNDIDEAWNVVEEMQCNGIRINKYTLSRMLVKTMGNGRTRFVPSRMYRGIGLVETFIELQPKDVDEVLFNALLDVCCRLKDVKRLELNVQRMQNLKVSPSSVTLGILVKTYGQARDLPKVLFFWNCMEEQRNNANVVTFGCMIDACIKCGHLKKAMEVFNGIRQMGKHRNTILYTTLIKGCGREKDLNAALELFQEMPLEGVPRNTITYNSIIDACVNCNDLSMAESIICEMTRPGCSVKPDLITFSTLLKGYCQSMKLDKALEVVQGIKARKIRCDELVYNTLMDGCVKANDIATGLGLFEEMIQNGLRPSAITHSILARLLHRRSECPGDVSELISQLYKQLGIEKPNRCERGSGFEGGSKGQTHKLKKSGSCDNRLPLTPLRHHLLATESKVSPRSDGSTSTQGACMVPVQ